ncbi:hypothetical protein F5Y13DRAFT_201435 [Hypoxylon sp. FL1857]|nr:hypothetical protein F5Y13DRAFT_201435 [Hypoxylon sp. FL1857]
MASSRHSVVNSGDAAPAPGIVNLNDKNHPFYTATEQNGSTPFLKLPIELRLMIYELAVAVDGCVRVHQVTKRSNKFVWGDHNKQPGSNGDELVRVTTEKQLTVVSLGRTCRQIYSELQQFPVFYRVNTFEFHKCPVINPRSQFESSFYHSEFLAAITPQRRKMIRHIQVNFTGNDRIGNLVSIDHPWIQVHQRHDKCRFLTLLSQCEDLREVSLVLSCVTTMNLLDYMAFTATPHDTPSPWNLPFLRLKLLFPGGTVFALGDSKTVPFDSLLANEPVAQQNQPEISQLNSIMFSRPRGHQRPKWFEDMNNPALVYEAIIAQQLDFPGEDRITRVQKTAAGSVSSRTRRNNFVFNELLGILQRDIPQYSADGTLAWEYSDVLKIRWDDSSEIECELIWSDFLRVPRTSWVPLRAIYGKEAGICVGRDRIADFYEARFARYLDSFSEHLEKMKSIPSPGRAFETIVEQFSGRVSEAFGLDNTRRGKVQERAFKNRWEKLASRWDARISDLEDKVAVLQAAEERRAARKAAREAARAARKQARGRAGSRAE